MNRFFSTEQYCVLVCNKMYLINIPVGLPKDRTWQWSETLAQTWRKTHTFFKVCEPSSTRSTVSSFIFREKVFIKKYAQMYNFEITVSVTVDFLIEKPPFCDTLDRPSLALVRLMYNLLSTIL